MPTYKNKDIYLERAIANGTSFEEAPLIVQPNSVLVTDAGNNLVLVPTVSFIPNAVTSSFAISASVATSASWVSASVTINSSSFATTASFALNSVATVTSASWGTRNINVGTNYSQSFSVTLQPSQSVYVKLTFHGFLANTGSIIFMGDYFVQNDGLTSYVQPGLIVSEVNHNFAGVLITSSIYNPGNSAISQVFPILLKSNAGITIVGAMTYEVRGAFNATSVNNVFDLGALSFFSASVTGSGDTFEAYAPQDPITDALASGNTGFTGFWSFIKGYQGVQSEEFFDYASGSFASGVNGGGMGFSGSWIAD